MCAGVKPDGDPQRIGRVLYVVRHTHHGREAASPPVPARLAVEAAVALAAAGRQVSVTDETGARVDVEELAEAVTRSAQAS